MYCKTCGAQMEDGMRFCTVCGAPLSNGVDLNKGTEPNGGMGAQGFNGQQQSYYGQPGQPGYGQPNYFDPNGQQGGYGYGQPGMGMGQPGMGMPGGGMFFGGIEERSIAMCIILSFVTCGIYLYYWLYKMTEETNMLEGDPHAASGGTSILLGIVTCGIYFLYWYYKRGEILDNYYVRRGYPPTSNAVLYLVLSIFGLGMVSMALCQNELNKIAHGM